MCSLCGMLGGVEHWTDPSSNPETFGRRTQTHTWHRERQDRTRIINAVLKHAGVVVSDWSGNAYVVRTLTGKTEIVENLSQIWAAVETLTGGPVDPLDPGLIAELSGGAGAPTQ